MSSRHWVEARRRRHSERSPADSDPRFELAWRLVDLADEVTSEAFVGQQWTNRLKADGSPVTEIDLHVERLVRTEVGSQFPGDHLLGEEFGGSAEDGEYSWLVDPIDGTANFVEGIPIFATLVSCSRHGRSVFAIVSAPMLGRRWWARAGHGAFRDNTPMTVSAESCLDAARIAYGGLRDYGDDGDGFVALVRSCMRARGFGNFLPHMLVADGTYDLASSGRGARPWDVMPLALVVAEAGGSLTSLHGGSWNDRDALLSSNGPLHRAASDIVVDHGDRRRPGQP